MRKLIPGIKQSEVELVFKYFDKKNENRFGYELFLSVLREDHLNLDKIRAKIEAYLKKHSLVLDDFFGIFANVKGYM
jgi:hypothetical protein